MTPSPIRIGLLGASRIAPPAIIEPARGLPSVDVVSVAARNPDKAKAFAAVHELPRFSASYNDLIADPEIDLIYNALPISEHARWSIAALQAGKHVLCEKPFAMNQAEAHDMANAAGANQRRLIEAFHYRYHPAFEQMLDWLYAGRIGDIQEVEASFNIGIPYSDNEIRHRPDTGGGAMMDLGCYPLNWVLALSDEHPEIQEATALSTAAGVDEFMSARIRLGNIDATISCDMRADTPFGASLNIAGTKGRIAFVNPLAPHHGGKLTLHGDHIEHAPVSEKPTYHWQLERVATALQRGEVLPTEGQTILRQQQALDEVYIAAGLGHLRGPQIEP